MPEVTAPVGKYDWLNKSIFISTLVDVPPEMRLAKGENENDRLIQAHRDYQGEDSLWQTSASAISLLLLPPG